MEAEVASPGLVDDERYAAIVCDLREGHDIGAGSEIGGRDDVRRDSIRVRAKLRFKIRRRDAVRDAQRGIDRGEHELQTQSGEDGSVDDRGVHRALDHRGASQGAQGEACDVVALGRAVGEEPRATRAPCLGCQCHRLLQRAGIGRSGLRQVHTLGEHRDVHGKDLRAGERRKGPVVLRLVLMPGDTEPRPLSCRIAVEGVGVGGGGYLGHTPIQSFGPVWPEGAPGFILGGRSADFAPLRRVSGHNDHHTST